MFAANFKHITFMNTSKSVRWTIQTLLLILIPINIFAHKNERFFSSDSSLLYQVMECIPEKS